MDDWRKQRGEFHHQGVQGTRSHPRKPVAGSWQPKLQNVPSWEKKFCFLVGSVPWRKILETKKYLHLYDDVVQWNDSAGKEAFHNAKTRFWAEMNGLPCDISSPDPDIYIDKIDWDSKIDEELLLDLERESVPVVEGSSDDNVVIIGNPLLLHPAFSCVGWGEAEEEFTKEDNLFSGSTKDKSSEKLYNNPWDSNYNGWDDGYNMPETEHAWGTCDKNGWNRESSGWNMSRYKTRRYDGESRQMGRGGGGERIQFSCNKARQWNSNYCRPISHDIASKSGNQWGN